MRLNKGLVKSLVTLCAILMLSSTAIAGKGLGPGDGNFSGDAPGDGTGNGPGDCTTQILTIDHHQLFAGKGKGEGNKGRGENGRRGPGGGTGTGDCVNS